jgi:hypothetical protein
MFFARSVFYDLGLETDVDDNCKGSGKNRIYTYSRGDSGATSSLRRFLRKLRLLRILHETFGLLSSTPS